MEDDLNNVKDTIYVINNILGEPDNLDTLNTPESIKEWYYKNIEKYSKSENVQGADSIIHYMVTVEIWLKENNVIPDGDNEIENVFDNIFIFLGL